MTTHWGKKGGGVLIYAHEIIRAARLDRNNVGHSKTTTSPPEIHWYCSLRVLLLTGSDE